MHLDLTPEQRALRDQLREYFASLVTPEYVTELAESEGGGPEYTRVLRKIGADGWLGIGWPKEYGGQGRDADRAVHLLRRGVRAPASRSRSSPSTPSGRRSWQFGTEEQKQDFLPRILRGELHFAIGYTEPCAGTDLASLRTRAVRDGDDWVINGQQDLHQPAPSTPTTSGSPRAPTPTRRSTRASRSSSCRHQAARLLVHADPHASSRHRPTRPSTTTCACPARCSSATRTRAGS